MKYVKCYFIYKPVKFPPTFLMQTILGQTHPGWIKGALAKGTSQVIPIPPSFSFPLCINKDKTSNYLDNRMHLGHHGTAPSCAYSPWLYPSAPNSSLILEMEKYPTTAQHYTSEISNLSPPKLISKGMCLAWTESTTKIKWPNLNNSVRLSTQAWLPVMTIQSPS
jgi:hypothetical protein